MWQVQVQVLKHGLERTVLISGWLSAEADQNECLICLCEYDEGDEVSVVVAAACTHRELGVVGARVAVFAFLSHGLRRPVAGRGNNLPGVNSKVIQLFDSVGFLGVQT